MTEFREGKAPSPYTSICDFSDWAGLRIDTAVFDGLAERLSAALEEKTESDLQWAQDRILRAGAFETGAVEDLYSEGATYSVSMEVDGWQRDLATSGDGAEDHFADQLAAYVCLRDFVAQGDCRELREAEIRALHNTVTRSQATHSVRTPLGIQLQAFPSGSYKTAPNFAIDRAGHIVQYAPVDDVAPEMGRLAITMQSAAYADAHPVIQCAYIHWAITHIHPFADGNGRMARVVGSTPLLRAFRVPLIVFAGRKKLYFQALEVADRHAHQEMVDYISMRARETYAWLAELLEGAEAGELADQSVSGIARLLEQQSDRFETSREAAERLRSTMRIALEREADQKLSCTSISYRVTDHKGYVTTKSLKYMLMSVNDPSNYEHLSGEIHLALGAGNNYIDSQSSIQFGYADGLSGSTPLIVQHDLKSADLFFNLEDCSPDLSVGAELRLRNLASMIVSHATKELERKLSGILRQHGRLPADER